MEHVLCTRARNVGWAKLNEQMCLNICDEGQYHTWEYHRKEMNLILEDYEAGGNSCGYNLVFYNAADSTFLWQPKGSKGTLM